jgi:biotin carboxyl carrier protein
LASETVEVPIAGKIIDIKVSVGMQVKEGDVICLLESMKMENPILAPVSGTIKEIQVSPAQVVKAGNTIAIIEF